MFEERVQVSGTGVEQCFPWSTLPDYQKTQFNYSFKPEVISSWLCNSFDQTSISFPDFEAICLFEYCNIIIFEYCNITGQKEIHSTASSFVEMFFP